MKRTFYLMMGAILAFGLLTFVNCKDEESEDLPENSFKDSRDGKIYKYVVIGNQTWMAENLAYDCGAGSSYYNNDAANAGLGRLYTYDAVKNKNLAPAGWHIPTDAEFCILAEYLDTASNCGQYLVSNIAGGKMKSTTAGSWDEPNAATNSSGFNAISAGWNSDPDYVEKGRQTHFWTTTIQDNNYSFVWSLDNQTTRLSHGAVYNDFANSIRCVKD